MVFGGAFVSTFIAFFAIILIPECCMLINGQRVVPLEGESVLDVAARVGVAVPVLCSVPEVHAEGGCGVCSVWDEGSKRLLPACAAVARTGLEIVTDSEVVQQARKRAVELLLSDHSADCMAPCERVCPNRFAVQRLLRVGCPVELRAQCDVCPAPCERACRNKLRIRELLKELPADDAVEGLAVRYGGSFFSVASRAAVAELKADARGCLQCGCGKPLDCRLREAAEVTGAKQHHGGRARGVVRERARCGFGFDSSRCVLCGLCVKRAAQADDACGVAFVGRGFDMRVGLPVGRSWDDVAVDCLRDCAAVCPTGAMTMEKLAQA